MKRFSLFDDRNFYKSLFSLAVPITLQNLINSFVNMLDTVMIGRLGTVEIAAVGLGNQVFFILNLTMFGICSGGAIFTAQFWGKRDIAGIRKNMGICIVLDAAVALLFTALALAIPGKIIGIYSKDPAVRAAGADYLRTLAPCFVPFGVSFVFALALRSIEKVKLSMAATVIALSVNMVLNYVFIFGVGAVPAMGVRGAALATVVARIVEMLILIVVSYLRKYPVAGSLREFAAIDAAFFRRYIVIAMPVVFNEIVWSLGVTVQNIIFARTGTEAIAAFNITNTFSQLTWVVFIGLGNGVAVLIGKKIGEGDEDAARDYARRITAFSPLVALAVMTVLFGISFGIPFIFNVNAEVLEIIPVMFILLCCSYPFRAVNMTVIVGICRAGGDTMFCFFFDFLSGWFYSLPLAALAAFVFHAPVWLIYLCVCTEDTVKMPFALWRLKSGKWLRNVT